MHIRAFFSIELPLSAKEIITEQLIIKLQKALHHHTIHWTRKENLHVTLQFLSEIDAFDIGKLINNVKIALENTPSFYLALGKPELFPSIDQPRIVSLSAGPDEILTQLAKKIGNGILQSDYPIETRPYRGHLTLGKIKQFPQKKLALNQIDAPEFEKILVKEVVLFRSEPSEGGSQYTELARLALSNTQCQD